MDDTRIREIAVEFADEYARMFEAHPEYKGANFDIVRLTRGHARIQFRISWNWGRRRRRKALAIAVDRAMERR